MLRLYIRQNDNNEKVGIIGNLSELIKEHNIGFSNGSIVGILKDMVTIIRRQVLNGQPVKIDDLAIFKASVKNRGGWSDLKDVSLHPAAAVHPTIVPATTTTQPPLFERRSMSN